MLGPAVGQLMAGVLMEAVDNLSGLLSAQGATC
jgi:hypothetical protein